MKVLVTGGASGLGKAISLKLLADGHEVLATFNSSASAARVLEQEQGLQIVRCDFSDTSSVASLCKKIADWQPDVLINNALTGLKEQYFHKTLETDFSESFEKNVLPVLQITQAAILVFRKKKSGKIITILSSVLANKPPIGWSAYTAEKAYLLSMSKSWAAENAKFGVVSNCVSPTFMATPLNRDLDERLLENMVQNHPLKRLLEVEEVAAAVAFLATATPHLNGTNLLINAAENVI